MTAPLRILMVSDVSPLAIRGGAERVLWEQASGLAARGHRVRIVSRSPEGDAAQEKEGPGIPIRHFSVRRRSPLHFLLDSILGARRAVTESLAAEAVDVVHLHQPLAGYGASRSPGARSLPSLYTFHSPAPLEYLSRSGMTSHHRPGLPGRAAQALLWGIERACLKRATRIHVLSSFSADLLWRLYGIPLDRIVRIPGGADIRRFRPAPDRLAVRRDLGLPEAESVLLTVRNLEARMGLDSLIRAMSLLRDGGLHPLLLIGGTGSLRESLEELVRSLDLKDRVRFLGYIPDPDLPMYYQAADAFVLPTRELEGFGLITVEALAAGTPVLGTPVGATPEILRPLDPSLIFRGTTPGELADGLRGFLEAGRCTPAAQAAFREACRRHAERNYTWDASVDSLEQTLANLGGRQPAATTLPEPCVACGSRTLRPDLAYLGAPYYRCPECGTGTLAALPTRASLRQRYEGEYPRRFSPETVPQSRMALFRTLLDHLGTPRPTGRLLDVGCGGGQLLASAVERSWRGVGTDLSHRACASAERLGLPVVQAEGIALPFRDGCLDAVTLINVLDQTTAPLDALHEANRVLAPGGQLAIRVPNARFHRSCLRLLTSLGPIVRWNRWDGIPVLHLFAFPVDGLRRLVDGAGFDVLEIRNSSLAMETSEAQNGGRPALMAWINLVITLAARSLACLSGGRCLFGPSLELYARRARSDRS